MIRSACIAILALAGATARAQTVTAADYARAERVHEANAPALVFGNRPSFRWSEEGAKLHYTINEQAGPRRWIIDTRTGQRIEDGAGIDPAGIGSPPDALPSPDGTSMLLVRENNLWLRTGQTERQLTHDGESRFGYGTLPDYFYRTIARINDELKVAPANVSWSPDGRTLFGQRVDERAVKTYPFIQWNPKNSHRPIGYDVRVALPGDPDQPLHKPYLVDIPSGRVRPISAPAEWQVEPNGTTWSPAGDRAWIVGRSEDGRGGALIELDVAKASMRTVISERSPGFFDFNGGSLYNAANIRILGGGKEAIWYSARDGWGNLYLYDLQKGRLKRQLTKGPGVVLDIIGIDERRRKLFFSAAGRNTSADPYHRHLYSVSLDGGKPIALTDDDRDHELSGPVAPMFRIFFRANPGADTLSPDFKTFVDVSSTLSDPPLVTLKSADTGKVVAVLDRGDASQLQALGWRPPRRFKVKAADGVTDIWGAIYLPPNYEAGRKFPVVDALYAGPQVVVAPRNFNEGSGARAQMFGRNSLAALGFIVVTMDARGTPGRSRDFHDVSYGNFADPQLDDHVAGLKQLAVIYPGMDLERVGTYGHSFGGYVAARALLRYPDFYKVGISSAGPHKWESFNDNMKPIFGTPDYGNGQNVRPTPLAVPERIVAVDNTTLADRLKGKLLLAYGDIDENAPPGNTMAMIAALTEAGKPYDLIYLPNTTHAYGGLDYFGLRSWDYFVEHLMGAAPPRDFRFGQQQAAKP